MFLLMAQFERSPVPLEDVCEEYFGMRVKQARMFAAAQSLPVPAFKLRNSEKSGWFIDLRDLANHIDKQREFAREDFIKINGGEVING